MSNFLENIKSKYSKTPKQTEDSTIKSLSIETKDDSIIEQFTPFTALNYEQACDFVRHLAFDKEDRSLNSAELAAFESLTYSAFGSLDGEMGTYNLKFGTEALYNKGDVVVDYEKIESNLDRDKNEGRSTIKFSTPEGGLLFQQHQRNKGIFLLWRTETICDRLLKEFESAESKTLGLDKLQSLTSGAPELHD